MPDLRERILNGLIGVVAGGLISLLALVPSSMVSGTNKWRLGVGIFVLFVLGIAYQHGRDIFNEYRENAKLAERYLDILPKTVRFDRYRRNIEINENGDGIVNDEYEVSNMGEDPITTLSIPQFCDIYEDIDILFERTDPDTALEVDQPGSFVDLLQLEVDEEPIPTAQAYDREGYLIGENVFQEKGQQKISFSAIGDLQPEDEEGQSTVNIELKYRAERAVNKSLTGEGDYIACDCFHPTDSIELFIYPPEDHEIRLHETASNPEAVDVMDMHGRIQDNHEKSAVSKPREIRGERLEWEIENPKVNYRYKIHFRCPQAADDTGAA